MTIIIPALNEEATIADVVQRVPREIEGIAGIEIVVIDDGSTDRTAELARQVGAEVVSHAVNRGVGAAFATGVRTALEHKAEIVVNMDGDGQFDPADLPKLLEPILFAGADFVSCTRFANPEFMPEMPPIKKWGNAVMTRLINRLAWGSNFTDVSCGFRAYTRDTLLRLNLMADYTYTQETFLNLAAQRINMAEVPLQILGTRPHGKSRVAGSITKYVLHTVPIIFRTLRDLRPLLFFGGIALAVSAKETSFVLPIIFGVWALWRVRPLKTAVARAVLIGAGSLAVFSLEHVFFYLWTGDWAYRYHAVNNFYGDPTTVVPLGLREFLYYIAHFLANPKVLGLCGWIMLVAVLRTFGKLREPHLILVWSLCFFLFMQYGSSSLSHYHPVPKQWRYMLPMVILLLIPIGRWTIDLYRSSVVGRVGTVLLTAGILICGIILANERAAERMYSEDSIRCLTIARQMQQRGELHDIAVPNWVARGTALDLQAGIAGWETVDLSDGLQREEAKRMAARDAVLLVPNVMWHHKRNDLAYMAARDDLTRHADTTELILDWRSPLDRLFAHLRPLRHLARRTPIGQCYRIDETTLEAWRQ
ncbi:MAG: glycosyltransferase family 2 protein [Planctomycetes bacterium]|nr:glycosyltransferase family 2 protein [Planctomycetota bacterium]